MKLQERSCRGTVRPEQLAKLAFVLSARIFSRSSCGSTSSRGASAASFFGTPACLVPPSSFQRVAASSMGPFAGTGLQTVEMETASSMRATRSSQPCGYELRRSIDEVWSYGVVSSRRLCRQGRTHAAARMGRASVRDLIFWRQLRSEISDGERRWQRSVASAILNPCA
jgi:hypothetical protein